MCEDYKKSNVKFLPVTNLSWETLSKTYIKTVLNALGSKYLQSIFRNKTAKLHEHKRNICFASLDKQLDHCFDKCWVIKRNKNGLSFSISYISFNIYHKTSSCLLIQISLMNDLIYCFWFLSKSRDILGAISLFCMFVGHISSKIRNNNDSTY